jgi:hypothetical protein
VNSFAAMKMAGYILSFYLLLLAAIPCCRFDDCPDDKSTTQQANNHESGDEDDCGSCSPFFRCEGCSPVTISGEVFYAVSTFFPVKQEYSSFVPGIIEDVHYDFWQPPQLS